MHLLATVRLHRTEGGQEGERTEPFFRQRLFLHPLSPHRGRLYFNRLRSNGRSKVAILGDVEQAACASDPALHADRALTETVTKQTDADCLLICAAVT